MNKGKGSQQPTMEENMSNLTSASGDQASVSSSNRNDINGGIYPPPQYFHQPHPQPIKKKRNQPGHPEPGAEVIALSPRTLLATNRFVCEVCNKGFQRDQNLQLHRRGHNLPWKLKQRTSKEVRRKVYVCPETSCVHHDPSRALGDLTGIKKHFFRKHGEKKWKCEKCSKKYAVQSDWKAHSKTCGTREYRCDCGTLFSRRDSFITHRAFCDALAQENVGSVITRNSTTPLNQLQSQFNISTENLQIPIKKEQENFILRPEMPAWLGPPPPIDLTTTTTPPPLFFQDFSQNHNTNPNPSSSLGATTLSSYSASPHISATALLQKAAQMGSKSISSTQFPSHTGVFIRPHQAHASAGDDSFAGFGLNLSSRDEFIHGLASYGNKAAPVTGGCTETGASVGGNSNNPSSSSSLLHQYAEFEGSTFDDIAFGEMLNHSSKRDHQNFNTALGQFSSRSSNESGGDDNMTRDFLGLRPLSQSDIFSITGLGNCINTNSCNENLNQTQKSWQG